MKNIRVLTLGEAWLRTSKVIMEEGIRINDGDQVLTEIPHVTLVVENPDENDSIISKYGDENHIQWMLSNFFEQRDVAELGNAKSYAVRLFNYHNKGLNQVSAVVDKLRKKPESKSATITTFMPLLDTTYIPCISMLDYWIREERLENVVYARSLDFGKKAYGNLIALTKIQGDIATQIGVQRGKLIVYIKSAHVYASDEQFMNHVLNEANGI